MAARKAASSSKRAPAEFRFANPPAIGRTRSRLLRWFAHPWPIMADVASSRNKSELREPAEEKSYRRHGVKTRPMRHRKARGVRPTQGRAIRSGQANKTFVWILPVGASGSGLTLFLSNQRSRHCAARPAAGNLLSIAPVIRERIQRALGRCTLPERGYGQIVWNIDGRSDAHTIIMSLRHKNRGRSISNKLKFGGEPPLAPVASAWADASFRAVFAYHSAFQRPSRSSPSGRTRERRLRAARHGRAPGEAELRGLPLSERGRSGAGNTGVHAVPWEFRSTKLRICSDSTPPRSAIMSSITAGVCVQEFGRIARFPVLSANARGCKWQIDHGPALRNLIGAGGIRVAIIGVVLGDLVGTSFSPPEVGPWKVLPVLDTVRKYTRGIA